MGMRSQTGRRIMTGRARKPWRSQRRPSEGGLGVFVEELGNFGLGSAIGVSKGTYARGE